MFAEKKKEQDEDRVGSEIVYKAPVVLISSASASSVEIRAMPSKNLSITHIQRT